MGFGGLAKKVKEAAKRAADNNRSAALTEPAKPTAEETEAAKLKAARESGMKEGEVFGSKYFGGGKTPEELNKITGSLLGMYQDQATKGINSPAFQAMRNTALQGINQQGMMGMRDLQAQQGASGMRGAAAMAQKQNMLQSQQQQRGQLENQLLLQDMAARERGQANLQQLLGGQQAGLMGAELGFGGLAVQDLTGAQQQILLDKYLGNATTDVEKAQQPVQPTWIEQFMKGLSQPDASMSVGGQKVPGAAVYAASPYTAAANYVYNAYRGRK